MNGRRDIERTLDLWLVDGPSAMPDRLFDAVLDRVERTPQRRLARLTLRLTEMNPRIRLYTFAAAGLVVALVGLYLFRGFTGPNVGASPSPAASPTPEATLDASVPAALAGNWVARPRGIEGFEPDAGVELTFENGSIVSFAQANLSGIRRLRSELASVGPDRFTVVTRDAFECASGDSGTYSWNVSSSAQTLTITAEVDACEARLAAMPGTFWRSDCPTPDDNCLGPVDAGSYSSLFFDPFLAPGGSWSARYGALTYTVPDNWVNLEDWPGSYALEAGGPGPTPAVYIIHDVVLSTRADPCVAAQDPDVGATAEALANGLARPGLQATAPVPVTIGGLSGYRVDVALDPAYTTPCPFSGGQPHIELLTDRPAADGWSWGIQRNERHRLYLLDVGAGHAILVGIHGLTDVTFDDFVGQATAVIDSFVFNP
jgi:hypothetical protein